jgi:tetratricopeptide (TPR) repeat protein
VTQAEPDYVDGWINIGRVRVQEGNLDGAEQVLRKALAMNPALARSHFFLAMALKGQGRYDEAIDHLRQAAAAYPRDRVVRNQLGRVLFLQRQFRAAVAEFTRVLQIDPEDLQAHYNLMLCYQGLGEAELASRERQLYLRFKADESAQAITGPYRRLHADDNNERQPLHEHRSALVSQR